ncbi:glia maturation factor beta [Patellaria atrata CBS 101060]|uniref:Glia maturation factor beta n=1 Tax=Patellaria atrata CBS 101060 TaxID=1346257 RepID=A0A9P4SA36_9PEZI|nr:glia maturation factor beta [Patellaria atrata CBS 101060]
MTSEARLYTISPETHTALRKFRLGTSRAKDPQAVIYQIKKDTLEISQEENPETYTSLPDIAADLPDHTPRFILLSYPVTLPSGRLSVPYVMLYYMPSTTTAQQRMLYAGAKELVREASGVGKVIEVTDAEEVEEVGEKLAAG